MTEKFIIVFFLIISYLCLAALCYASGYYDGLEKKYETEEEKNDFEEVFDRGAYSARRNKPIDFEMRCDR